MNKFVEELMKSGRECEDLVLFKEKVGELD